MNTENSTETDTPATIREIAFLIHFDRGERFISGETTRELTKFADDVAADMGDPKFVWVDRKTRELTPEAAEYICETYGV